MQSSPKQWFHSSPLSIGFVWMPNSRQPKERCPEMTLKSFRALDECFLACSLSLPVTSGRPALPTRAAVLSRAWEPLITRLPVRLGRAWQPTRCGSASTQNRAFLTLIVESCKRLLLCHPRPRVIVFISLMNGLGMFVCATARLPLAAGSRPTASRWQPVARCRLH